MKKKDPENVTVYIFNQRMGSGKRAVQKLKRCSTCDFRGNKGRL
jgi:hypothetical protein